MAFVARNAKIKTMNKLDIPILRKLENGWSRPDTDPLLEMAEKINEIVELVSLCAETLGLPGYEEIFPGIRKWEVDDLAGLAPKEKENNEKT